METKDKVLQALDDATTKLHQVIAQEELDFYEIDQLTKVICRLSRTARRISKTAL